MLVYLFFCFSLKKKRRNAQQPLPFTSSFASVHKDAHKPERNTAKPALHDTFCAGGPIWIIQYGEFKVSVFIEKAAGVRERNILDELVSF